MKVDDNKFTLNKWQDEMLFEAVHANREINGRVNWTNVVTHIGSTRSSRQCRDRWKALSAKGTNSLHRGLGTRQLDANADVGKIGVVSNSGDGCTGNGLYTSSDVMMAQSDQMIGIEDHANAAEERLHANAAEVQDVLSSILNDELQTTNTVILASTSTAPAVEALSLSSPTGIVKTSFIC